MAKQTLKLGENETEYESLSEDEVKNIVGTTLDEKLSALELPETFDADTFKKSLLEEVTSIVQSNKTDEDALVKRLEKTLDSSLGKILKGLGKGGSKEKQPGALSRFLSS